MSELPNLDLRLPVGGWIKPSNSQLKIEQGFTLII